jgi:hypothetical protein
MLPRWPTIGRGSGVVGTHSASHLTERAVNGMVKRTARKAGISEAVSPHWLRHAHGSHAIDRGASLPEVQSTLGHGNIAATSGYLHILTGIWAGLTACAWFEAECVALANGSNEANEPEGVEHKQPGAKGPQLSTRFQRPSFPWLPCSRRSAPV